METNENIYEEYNQYADGGFEWQEECLNEIQDKNNVIISSPTGSGKTRVFLEWAKGKEERPIIITAPIKALSNQRYRELLEAGFVVGLETGDIKSVPENCEFLCCTQEIYTNKYAEVENATLIMDEFHYIFENPDRARTYVDALQKSKAKNILLCSATLGNLEQLTEYVEKVSARDFHTYENHSRLTSLLYEGETDAELIENALVVAFSRREIQNILDRLADIRYTMNEGKSPDECEQIEELAKENEIKSDFIMEYAKCGLAGYFGAMLPKEKLFIETCFEKGLIDTVVGTDALALGVNFPVENVVFAQLAKCYSETISKNLFEQLAGRAGRKGYYDEGHVFYCDYLAGNIDGFDPATLYDELLEKPNEDISIFLNPNIKDILTGKTTIEDEVAFISNYSTDERDEEYELGKLQDTIKYIREDAFEMAVESILRFRTRNSENNEYEYDLIENENENEQDDDYEQDEDYYDEDYEYDDDYEESEETIKLREELMAKKEEFDRMIPRVYFDEFTPEDNCEIFANILCGTNPDIILREFAPKDNFYKMLQFRKYVMSLPKEYRQGLTKVTEVIRKIDRTAIEGYRGKVSTKSASEVLETEQKMSKENIRQVLQELKDQKSAIGIEERINVIDEQLRIADEYELEEY